MARPTIHDLAKAAGVSVSTVNRVLAGSQGVRDHTVLLVKQAAEQIGFYGLGTIRSGIEARRPKYRFGFLLLQPSRTYYQELAQSLQRAAKAATNADVEAIIKFSEDLSPQNVAAQLLELGETCQAIGVVAAVHPLVLQAVEALQAKGIPVIGLVSQLSATGNVSYVGLDNWKEGRTAAWALANLCKTPGKVGILVGNHRFRCQEMNEVGFRSYFREFAADFTVLETLSTFETSAVAEEMTEKLVSEHGDLKGIFVAGGGISGVINALRTTGMAGKVVTVGHQLMNNTKLGLLDGTLSVILHLPMEILAERTISSMQTLCESGTDHSARTTLIPFEIFTRENI